MFNGVERSDDEVVQQSCWIRVEGENGSQERISFHLLHLVTKNIPYYLTVTYNLQYLLHYGAEHGVEGWNENSKLETEEKTIFPAHRQGEGGESDGKKGRKARMLWVVSNVIKCLFLSLQFEHGHFLPLRPFHNRHLFLPCHSRHSTSPNPWNKQDVDSCVKLIGDH